MSQVRRRQFLIAAGALLAMRDVSSQPATGQLPKVGVFHWGSADDGRVTGHAGASFQEASQADPPPERSVPDGRRDLACA